MSNYLQSIAICDGLDLDMKILLAGRAGFTKKKLVTTKWRSSNSRFCCKQHRTPYSFISCIHCNLKSMFFIGCACWSNISETNCYIVSFLKKLICCAFSSFEKKQSKLTHSIRGKGEKSSHFLLWIFTALC